MFSIFHALFTVFAYGVDSYNKTSQDEENRERAKQSGSKTYHGSRGNEYLVENNKWVSTKLNSQGEEVIADMKTGQVYYNLTKERKKEKEKEYVTRGKTVRPKMYNECNRAYYGKWRQTYSDVDIATGIPVKDVSINNTHFYIRLDNAQILRLVDGEECKYILGVWTPDEIISIINERQKRIVNEIRPDEYSRVDEEIFFKNQKVYITKDKDIKIIWNRSSLTEFPKLLEKDGFKYNKEEKTWTL